MLGVVFFLLSQFLTVLLSVFEGNFSMPSGKNCYFRHKFKNTFHL